MTTATEVVRVGLAQIPVEGLRRLKRMIKNKPGRVLMDGKVMVLGEDGQTRF